MKLSDKQKEVVIGLRCGNRIYTNADGVTGFYYSGGNAAIDTLNIFIRLGLLEPIKEVIHPDYKDYTLTPLGRTIEI